jgi:hypothetical protein
MDSYKEKRKHNPRKMRVLDVLSEKQEVIELEMQYLANKLTKLIFHVKIMDRTRIIRKELK